MIEICLASRSEIRERNVHRQIRQAGRRRAEKKVEGKDQGGNW